MSGLDKIKNAMAPFGKGLLAQAIPGMASGLIIELFHQWKITTPLIIEYIKTNRSLWGDMDEQKQTDLIVAAQKVGNLDFITADFLINSIRKDFSGVASLFLNWPEAREWLERQIIELKAGINNEI